MNHPHTRIDGTEVKFHRDAYGLPRQLPGLSGNYNLTRHAAERCCEKAIPASVLREVDASGWQVFEACMQGGRVVKLAARRPLGDGRDVVAVFAVEQRAVVTAWTNRSTDRHCTLDRRAYSRP